jgi:hypothetical protein
MRPVPAFLPGANSKKWHSRRSWDNFGYLRVRTITNPNWERDVPWLLQIMSRSRPLGPDEERERFDSATAALQRYADASRHGIETALEYQGRLDRLWDDFLEALDAYLELIQAEHLRQVDEAGVSGRPSQTNRSAGSMPPPN